MASQFFFIKSLCGFYFFRTTKSPHTKHLIQYSTATNSCPKNKNTTILLNFSFSDTVLTKTNHHKPNKSCLCECWCIGFHQAVGVDNTASTPCIRSQTSSIKRKSLPHFSHHQNYKAFFIDAFVTSLFTALQK